MGNSNKNTATDIPLAGVDSGTSRNQPVFSIVPNNIPPTLSVFEAAAEITAISMHADVISIGTAKKAYALKCRVVAGEAGKDVKWMEWMKANVGLSSSRIYELLAIGRAKHPENLLEQYRCRDREKHKVMRERAKDREANQTDDKRAIKKIVRALSDREAAQALSLLRRHFPSH